MRVSAYIAVEGRVLLVQQRRAAESGRPAYWLLPGGGVGRGETLAAAAVRELLEETGVEVEPGPPIALVESISPDPAYHKHVIHVLLQASWPSSAPTEHLQSRDPLVLGLRFFAADELGGLQIRPPLNDYLRRYLDAPPSHFEYLGLLW